MGERPGGPAIVPERVERMGFFARINGIAREGNPYRPHSAGHLAPMQLRAEAADASLASAWWSGWDRADRLAAAFDRR